MTKKRSLNDKQKRFCNEYIIDFNATQAAIRSGYSEKTAGAIGSENLKKPDIRKFIDEVLEKHSLGRGETLKLISDIAQGSLNEYFTTEKEIKVSKVEKGLSVLIQELKEKIEDQKKLIDRAKITDADSLKDFSERENRYLLEILQFEIELERNPKAYRIVDGEPKLVQVSVLDLPKLVKDKERGKIKTLTPNEHGYKIELYAADAALRDLGRYHGLFEKDNEQSKLTITQPMTDAQVDKVLKEIRKPKK